MSKSNGKSTQMTVSAAARISSATARGNGGSVPKGSFASRATSAAARNAYGKSGGRK